MSVQPPCYDLQGQSGKRNGMVVCVKKPDEKRTHLDKMADRLPALYRPGNGSRNPVPVEPEEDNQPV